MLLLWPISNAFSDSIFICHHTLTKPFFYFTSWEPENALARPLYVSHGIETCLPVCAFHLQDQNFDHLILECCEGSINDAELKAHLEQFGEVIEVRIYACVCEINWSPHTTSAHNTEKYWSAHMTSHNTRVSEINWSPHILGGLISAFHKQAMCTRHSSVLLHTG